MIQSILFDSDGVLVDTERLFFEATQEAFARFGAVIPPDFWAVWYLAESRPSREVARLQGVPASQIEETIQYRDQLFWAKVAAGVSVFPGVRETLGRLSGKFRLGVVTGASRSHFEGVHAATGLMDFFEIIVTADDYDVPKPSPQCYLKAMQVLSVNPQYCLAVEDSPRGAAAAISAGARCAVIPTPLTNLSLCPGACDVLSSMAELSLLAGS